MSRSLRNRAAIAGIGQTEFSKASGRSELQLACEAIKAALDDAGLAPARRRRPGHLHDGLERGGRGRRATSASRRCRCSRASPTAAARACAVVMQAAMAVATGVADVVVCYRAFNERSGMRFGGSGHGGGDAAAVARHGTGRTGCSRRRRGSRCTRAATCTSTASPTSDFGRISVVDRKHAATNPHAWFYQRPITLEEHQSSRWIVEPVLRLLDCCQESDGGVALVVTTPERARDLRQPPALIAAAAQGAADDGELMTSYYRDDITGLPEMGVVARASCGPSRASRPPTSRPRSSTTTSRRSCSCSSRSSASAGAARRRTSRPSRTCRSAAACRSTPAAACSARPTSTA